MVRDTVQLETAVSTISQEYLLEFTSEYGISEDLHPELPIPEERIVDFLEGKGIPTVAKWRTSAPKDEIPARDTYSVEAVKTGTRPRATHEVSLLTVTASRVIEMEDLATTTDSFGVPLTIERSPVDFANENPSQQSTGGNETEDQEAGLAEEIAAMGPRVIKERHKRGNDGENMNAPPKVLKRDHADSRLTESTIGGKSLAAMGLGIRSTFPAPTLQDTLVDVSDPNPLSFANPQSIPIENVAQSSKGAAVAGDPESVNTSFTSMVGSSKSIYQSEWGVTKATVLMLRKPAKTRWITERHKVAMGSQLRLRFEHEAKLLKKSVAQVARRDQRIQARENEIKNLEALLEVETDMKKTAEAKNAKLGNVLENLCALFLDLQLSNDRLSQQVSTLQAQVTGEEKLKAAFEEFKQYEDDRVEKRCAEMGARLDALSIDFDEELYPYMLTAIAGRRWVIGHGLRLAVMKCGKSTELRQVFTYIVLAGIAKGMSRGLKYGVEHGKANLDLEAIEACDPEADTKYVAALHALRDLKYPMVEQLESLKDAPIDVIMASLHLESGTEDDALQWIRKLRPSSSQLKIPIVSAYRFSARSRYPVGRRCYTNGDIRGRGLSKMSVMNNVCNILFTSRICIGSVSCAPWESSRMHLTS
nr:hypothetical protein [Tanacetum cinerariifolium]